ncbi:MAG: NAD-dependent epimerase/dehydratase family protein [Deltaproteobacteria bacterium]|nr:NAD-dependent epimerase/dehydratase family protein [Deltaproteobacteria bacterium]
MQVANKTHKGEKGRRPSARAKPFDARNRSSAREEGDRVAAETPEHGATVITGICGRLGQLLARELHRCDRVIGIDRRPFEGCPEDIVHYQLDLRRNKTQDVFRSNAVKAVVHLGIMHNLRENDREHHSWNVVGFKKILEYVEQYRVPKLILLSSANLYGPNPENPQFLSEEAPLLGAQDFSQIRDLVDVDMLAQSFFWKRPQTETVILRPCHILGKVRNAPSNYLRLKRPITLLGYDPMMQVIHERDVVDAIVHALKPGQRGIFNLSGAGQLPLSRLIRMLNKPAIPLPAPLVKSAMRRLWSYRVSDYSAPEFDHLRYTCMVDGSRALEQLGFRPSRGIRETLEAVYNEV